MRAEESQDAHREAFRRHRRRLVRGGDWVRVIGSASFAVAHAVLGYGLDLQNYRGNLDVWSLYFVLALLVWGAGRRWDRVVELGGWVIVLVDMPMVLWLQLRLVPGSNDMSGIANFTAAVFVVLVVWSALTLNRGVMVAAAVQAILLEGYLMIHCEADIGGPVAMALITLIVTGLLSFAIDTLTTLVANVTEERTARAAQERLNQEKDQFVAIVSHDFRSPLAMAMARLQTMQQDPNMTPEDRVTFLDSVERQLRRLHRLVEDLLGLAQLRDRQAGQRSDRDVRELAAECGDEARPRFSDKGVSLELELPTTPVPARVDAPFVERAISNLLDNACKFTPAGGHVRLRVRGEPEVMVEVEDDGPGIDPAERERLFERFFRGKAGAASGQGSGLGLSIVAEVARQHRGRVEVDSRGAGTCFRLVLGERAAAAEPVEQLV